MRVSRRAVEELSAVAEGLQDPSGGPQPQADQGSVFDLPDSLTTDRKLAPDRLQRMRLLAVKAEVQLEDARLTFRQVRQTGFEDVPQCLPLRPLISSSNDVSSVSGTGASRDTYPLFIPRAR